MMSMSSLTTWHGPFAPPIIQSQKASPGAAIFGWDMLFDIPFIVNWNKIGDYRKHQTDLSTAHENKKQIDYDYKTGDRVLVI